MAESRGIPINKKDFIALEFLRLVGAINQTDPRSRDYAQLLENIERFAAAAVMFDDLWAFFASYYTEQGAELDDPPVSEAGKEPEIIYPKFSKVKDDEHNEPETPAPEQEEVVDTPAEAPAEVIQDAAPVEEAPVYDAAEVKKAIGKARADGLLPKIKDWLMENWGVEGFSALPAAKYGEAMEKLKSMGVVV